MSHIVPELNEQPARQVRYGFHYGDEGYYFDSEHDDVWSLLQDLFLAARSEEEVANIRVGEVTNNDVESFVDEETFWRLFDAGSLSLESYVGAISAACARQVMGGEASLRGGTAAQESTRLAFEVVAAPALQIMGSQGQARNGDIVASLSEVARNLAEWAVAHVELEPPTTCYGCYPLPVAFIEGFWWAGVEAGDLQLASAVIDFNFRRRCWDWQVAGGISGDEGTIQEAMRVSRAVADDVSKVFTTGAQGGLYEYRAN